MRISILSKKTKKMKSKSKNKSKIKKNYNLKYIYAHKLLTNIDTISRLLLNLVDKIVENREFSLRKRRYSTRFTSTYCGIEIEDIESIRMYGEESFVFCNETTGEPHLEKELDNTQNSDRSNKQITPHNIDDVLSRTDKRSHQDISFIPNFTVTFDSSCYT